MRPGSAFPNVESAANASTGETINYETTPGMSKREYFAAAALQGICASPHFKAAYPFVEGEAPRVIALAAIMIADALISELTKEKI